MQPRNNPERHELVRGLVPDLDQRLSAFDRGPVDLDEELLQVFLDQLAVNLTGLREALAEKNHADAGAEAHSLRGMGGLVGCPELSVLADEIERQVEAQNEEAAQKLFDGLKAWRQLFASGL